MPKSDDNVLELLVKAKGVIYSFMALDALCFLVIFIVLCALLFKLTFRNGKENFDNIVMNWDFNEEPTESKLPCKFSFACVISLIVYLAIYGVEFLYFASYSVLDDLPTEITDDKQSIEAIEKWLRAHEKFGANVALLDLCTYLLFIITKFLLFG